MISRLTASAAVFAVLAAAFIGFAAEAQQSPVPQRTIGRAGARGDRPARRRRHRQADRPQLSSPGRPTRSRRGRRHARPPGRRQSVHF